MKIVNGVNLSNIESLYKKVKQTDALGDVTFSAKSEWLGGTRTEVSISSYYAGGYDLAPPTRQFKILMDEPVELGGQDTAPNPMEYLLAALCGCITAALSTNAGFSNAEIATLTVEVNADVNIRGLLGIDDSPSNCEKIDYRVKIAGTDEAVLLKAKHYVDKWSSVLSTLKTAINVATSEEVSLAQPHP